MYWLLQENICQEQKWQELIDTLQRMGIQHSVHKVVPFSGELIPFPEHITYSAYSKNVWAMGSLAMENVCKANFWAPGVIPVPSYDVMIKHWGDRMLNADAFVATIDRVATRRPFSNIMTRELFVRPVDDSKFIKGQLMSELELYDWANNICTLGANDGSNVNAQSKVMIAKRKNIQQEVRFWIVNGEIATYSLYKLGSTITYSGALVDPDFIWFASSIAANFNSWQPAQAYCLDLCRDDNNKIKVVEVNNINSSGLYDCDVQKLIMAVEGARF